jgi:hypothetical protein
MKPGDFVLVIEHRDNEQLVHKGLAVSLSMDEQLAGADGQCAITASFVGPLGGVSIEDVVHISHRDWIEGRAGLAYEDLPHPLMGVCRFCLCTEQRACPCGCSWLDLDGTACSAPECKAKFIAEYQAFGEVIHG